MKSIKTNFEMPRGDDPVKQAQRLAQDLSSNFKAINSILGITDGSSSPILLNGVEVSQSWSGSTSGQSYSSSFTIAHNLGVTPSGWILVDSSHNGSVGFGAGLDITRTSWTNSDITIRINLSTGSNGTFNGSFKILVLR